MSDDKKTVMVHRVTLMVVDHDQLGSYGVTEAIESVRYPNHCMNPQVAKIETEAVEWDDSIEINKRDGWQDAFERLFLEPEKYSVKVRP